MEVPLPGYYACNEIAVDIPTFSGEYQHDAGLPKDRRDATYQQIYNNLVAWSLTDDNDNNYTNSRESKICGTVKVVSASFVVAVIIFIWMTMMDAVQQEKTT